MLHDTPVYRSRPAELARAASAFFALLLVGIAAFGVEQAIAHGSYVAFTVVYCILTLAFLVLLRWVSDCRLVATPSGLDIVKRATRHPLAWDDIAGVMFGDELPGSMPLTFFADRRHVVVKTANGQLVNIAALTLWTKRWGVQRVHDIVTKLNAEVSARRIATTAS